MRRLSPVSPSASTLAGSLKSGFTLVEMLLVIAIIGIMSALIVSTVTNAAQDSRTVVARQQQVILQEALNAWIAQASSGTNTVASARTTYSAAGTSLAKLALLTNYLHSQTYSHFTNYSSSDHIKSEAMTKAGLYLQFSSWGTNASNSYPVVQMMP